MKKYSQNIDWRTGVDVCLNCPYDDCIGQQFCPELNEAHRKAQKVDNTLDIIAKALKRNNRPMSISEITEQCSTYREKIYRFIRDGKLKVEMANKRKKMIIEVIL